MLSLLVLIRCVYVFRKISNEIEINTLSFCTDYDMRKFECLLFEGDDTEDAGKIIENKKYLTDQILDLKNVKNYSLFEDWNPLMYIVKYQKLNNTNITLVSLNEFKEPCMYVKISSYVEYESFHQFEFTKATSTPNQNTESQVTLSCKLLKGQTNNDLTIIIVSDSNLGSMKSLLSLEFLSINSDLKKFVFKPMKLAYSKIINFFRDKSIDQGKINLFYKKFSIFLTVEKKATMLRYIFLTSENLELTYLNSDNMSFDEEKLFVSKLTYIREITIEIISAIKDILSEVQYIGISEDVIALIEEITKFLSSFYDKYENLLKKNLGSIQEKKFIKQVGKEDKIHNCFEFLNLYFNYQSLKADLFLLLCDYYANSLHLEKSRGLFDLYSSIVCVKKIQIKLLKDCIEKPTVRNLTKYLTFNESENVKVKDLQTLWIKFKKYFKMLDDEIEKQQEPNEYLVIIKQRQKTLEEQSEKLKADIDLFLVESFYFADLFLKTSIITYLLDNNEDVLRHKNL